MKAGTKRLILRVVHLVAVIPVFGYTYQPVSEVEQYMSVTHFVFIPVVILTGYWMYAGLIFAILGAASWVAGNYFVGFGTALLAQIVLFAARKIWLMTRKRPAAVAEARTSVRAPFITNEEELTNRTQG